MYVTVTFLYKERYILNKTMFLYETTEKNLKAVAFFHTSYLSWEHPIILL